MPVLTRELTINVRDPNRAGILRSFYDQTTVAFGVLAPPTEFMGLRLVEPVDGDEASLQDVDPTGATLEIGLGDGTTIYASQNAFTPYPAAGYALTDLQVGDATHASIRALKLTPAPYGGEWLLQGGALAWNDSATNVQTALGTGYTVAKPDPDSSTWIITQGAVGAENALTINVASLVVPLGAVVELALNTQSMADAFAATAAPQLALMLQCRITLPGQDPFTFLLENVPVSREVLTPGVVAPGPFLAALTYNPQTGALVSPTAAALLAGNPILGGGAFNPAVTSVGDAAPGSLETVPTLATATPALTLIYLPTANALQPWLLYPSDAATATGIQRPNDFDPVSNAKVWFHLGFS